MLVYNLLGMSVWGVLSSSDNLIKTDMKFGTAKTNVHRIKLIE